MSIGYTLKTREYCFDGWKPKRASVQIENSSILSKSSNCGKGGLVENKYSTRAIPQLIGEDYFRWVETKTSFCLNRKAIKYTLLEQLFSHSPKYGGLLISFVFLFKRSSGSLASLCGPLHNETPFTLFHCSVPCSHEFHPTQHIPVDSTTGGGIINQPSRSPRPRKQRTTHYFAASSNLSSKGSCKLCISGSRRPRYKHLCTRFRCESKSPVLRGLRNEGVEAEMDMGLRA